MHDQCSRASASQLQHTTAGTCAFSLWCVSREGPGLSPFSRVDGNRTMFLEREDMEKVIRGRESVYKVHRAGAWSLAK